MVPAHKITILQLDNVVAEKDIQTNTDIDPSLLARELGIYLNLVQMTCLDN